MRPSAVRYLAAVATAAIALFSSPPAGAQSSAPPLASLQSFTGIWDMPTARVLEDWHLRVKYGSGSPYRYYGVAMGFFDRLEVHGQFTTVTTLTAFAGHNYGHYKDRSAGARLVLVKESPFLPQVAVGAYDAIGTLLFPYRYLVASKRLGNFDLTLGLGQGLLGGQGYREIQAERDPGVESFDTTFLFSSPFRPTRPFGGFEYSWSDRLTLAAEYTPIKYEKMFGTPEKADLPLNLGVKYRATDHLYLQAGYLRGKEVALGLAAELPLSPQGILPWKKGKPFAATERQKGEAHTATDRRLAGLLVDALHDDGFSGVAVAVRDEAVWVELANTKHLSNARALGRIGRILDQLLPERIQTLYLNLTTNGQVTQSLKTNRQLLRAYMEQRMDKRAFLDYSSLTLHDTLHYKEFFRDTPALARQPRTWFDFEINPKVKTFLNNKNGFFKHKAVLQPRLKFFPWRGGALIGEMEFTLYNEWGGLDFAPLEREATRTDIGEYEKRSSPRLTMLAYNQFLGLPLDTAARFSAGIFESTYAGVGGEVFRYFSDGRYGIGAEATAVRKRDRDANFRLDDTITHTYTTAHLNLYANLFPDWGIEGGLRIGRFLAGDTGARLELRRSFKYFTVGAWYTDTDTSIFQNPKNRGTTQKGVYIRVPLSIFTDHDIRGHLNYVFTSFTRDPGQMVRQPASLYPMDPFDSVDYTRRTLDDMRQGQ